MAEYTDFIQIFPSGKRANVGELNSRKLTEQNIRNILNSITDNHSFVISDSFPASGDTTTPFEFVVDGYYFSITRNNIGVIDLTGNLWVGITLTSEQDTSDTYSELNTITFSTTEPPNQDFTLQLLSDGKVKEESKIKFENKSVSLDLSTISDTVLGNITTIDGNYSPPSQ